MTRVFYGVVRTDPPRLHDFVTNQAKGRIPARPLAASQLRQWDGVSVFATEMQA